MIIVDNTSVHWIRIKKSNPTAVAMANRHYSRITFGTQGAFLGPPGRLICLMTNDESAVWVSHWPYEHLALDKLDAHRCTMFRNEGDGLSSRLIQEARELTQSEWGPPPIWITWVAPYLVESSNPGYCFKMDGWEVDKDWKSSRRNVTLIRMYRRPE